MLAVWSGMHLALSLVTEVENGIGTRYGLCVLTWCPPHLFMGMLQTPTPAPESAAFLFLALKDLELGDLTVSYLLAQN